MPDTQNAPGRLQFNRTPFVVPDWEKYPSRQEMVATVAGHIMDGRAPATNVSAPNGSSCHYRYNAAIFASIIGYQFPDTGCGVGLITPSSKLETEPAGPGTIWNGSIRDLWSTLGFSQEDEDFLASLQLVHDRYRPMDEDFHDPRRIGLKVEAWQAYMRGSLEELCDQYHVERPEILATMPQEPLWTNRIAQK